MKPALLLGFLFATTTLSVHAQQSPAPTLAPATTTGGTPATTPATAPAAKDEWGTEATPPAPAPAPADGLAPAADAAAAPGTAPSGIDAALGAEKSATRSTAIKPITTQPKLNPNSSGVYDKKVVKNQNKHTEKIVRKRRNVTARYADIRRGEQINGIRRMEKGKISTSSRNR